MASRDPLEEEFREFVAARSGALLRTAYLLAGDWATAEDLLQTALTKTYLAWKRLGGIDAIEPYARRVLVNTSTSWWRRRWHGERPTEVLPERAGVDEIEHQLDRDALWRHLQALPARQRAVLVLRFYEDMSEAQTAALLEISPGTVKSQTSRALNTLRRRLGSETDLGLPTERGAQASPAAPPGRPSRPAPARQATPAGAPVRQATPAGQGAPVRQATPAGQGAPARRSAPGGQEAAARQPARRPDAAGRPAAPAARPTAPPTQVRPAVGIPAETR
ncbi:SigE family RNA polymerase sigma factor [Micromonospora sp. NPDC050980]|uniref:SigE family RNA polymerase sigma factor n=1 Tax=Micromonospora sp. NPDC050980 TaxID=3155161 RepID=UPI0033E91BE9